MAAVSPPIEPMLAKLADELPQEGNVIYEPKWDGFRALVFKNARSVYLQSRDLRPLDRYFPDLHDAALKNIRTYYGTVMDAKTLTGMWASKPGLRKAS